MEGICDETLVPVDAPGGAARDAMSIAAWFAALSALYWAAVLLVCGRVGFPLDDAFIHLQFARHLADDGQMAFNAGVPSGGSTAPLYPVLLAAAHRLLTDWYTASYALGALCSLGTAWAAYGITRSWTGRRTLARWAGMVTVIVPPTVVQAYGGMESPTYSLLFLIGLWCYTSRRRRLMASAFWSVGIWLRPEFAALLPMIVLERFLAATGPRWSRWRAVAAECTPHLLIWSAMGVAYAAYHHGLDGHFLPTTFAAKSVAPGMPKPAWMESLPAAIHHRHWGHVLLAIGVWPMMILLSVAVGLAINCAPLAFGLPRAMAARWRDTGAAAPGWRIAILVLVGYPWIRGLVDSWGVFMFQQQRYYAHLTPLAVLLVIGALPATGAVVAGARWNWRGVTDRLQLRRTMYWAAAGSLLVGAVSVTAVSNINAMQVTIGRWIRDHTEPDQIVATNDIGAIAFVSGRRVLDTVGLVEPDLVEHYLAGGSLADYVQARRPAYLAIFPRWYPDLSSRADVVDEVFSVALRLNVVCGGSRMVVYRLKQ